MIKNIFNRHSRAAVYIAEIGLNHNGDFGMAKKMIDLAGKAGVDGVKFQTFLPESMNSQYTTSLMNKGFEEFRDSTQFDFFSRFCFNESQYIELKSDADSRGMVFFSSPFDIESVELLEKVGVPVYKIASSEVTNHILLQRIGQTGKPVIMSTGISTEYEISLAMDLLRKSGAGEISLMHCVSLYPPRPEHVNLKRIETLREKFKIEVGFSDHTRGMEADIIAAAMGARIFEKHFTIDGNYQCPDREVSITPGEFLDLIHAVEKCIKMIGTGEMAFSHDEDEVAKTARRSLFAKRFIPRDKVIDMDDLIALRPGMGIPVYEIGRIIGKKTRFDIVEGFLIKNEDLE